MGARIRHSNTAKLKGVARKRRGKREARRMRLAPLLAIRNREMRQADHPGWTEPQYSGYSVDEWWVDETQSFRTVNLPDLEDE